VIFLRLVLGVGCLLWLAFWFGVLVDRWNADPLAVVAGLLLFLGWFVLRRRTAS
jgi:hypothetical protein